MKNLDGISVEIVDTSRRHCFFNSGAVFVRNLLFPTLINCSILCNVYHVVGTYKRVSVWYVLIYPVCTVKCKVWMPALFERFAVRSVQFAQQSHVYSSKNPDWLPVERWSEHSWFQSSSFKPVCVWTAFILNLGKIHATSFVLL